MSVSCNRCQNVIFVPAQEGNLHDFQAKIHADVAELERCVATRACDLCTVLHGILANRARFGPTGRQSPESAETVASDISLWLHYEREESDEEGEDDWEYVQDDSAEEDAPRDVVFRHPLGTDDLSIRNAGVIARSAWYEEGDLPLASSDTSYRTLGGGSGSCSPNLSTGSDASLSLAKSWVRACCNTHGTCRRESDDVPKRLLDVSKVKDISNGMVHLVNSLGIGLVQYLTLSHRWNPTYNYFTTTDNVQAHLEHGMDISRLPKTFAEACLTTKRLEYDYIWIDSLCIVQDSSEDKASEIPKMADYYQNAELNLSASTESLGALWSARDGSSTAPFTLRATLHLPGAGGTAKRCSLDLAPVLRAAKSHLDYRGWILQERIFPRRTLFFDAYWLAFECGAMTASESCPRGVELGSASNHVTVENGLATKLQRDCNLSIIGGVIRNLNVVPAPATKQQALTLWYRILHEYSLRQLSFETDRLDAIAGLAERLSKILEDDYIGGMWKSNIVECLQWQPDDPVRGSEAIRQTQYRAPTWSWASCELLPRSSFRDARRTLPLQISNEYVSGSASSAMVEILDLQWQCESSNKFGNLDCASLTLRGRPLRGFAYVARAPDMELEMETITEKVVKAPGQRLTGAGRTLGKRALTWVHISGRAEGGEPIKLVTMVSPDTSDHKVEGCVYLLPLATRWLPGAGDRLFCLVLKEANQGVFERVGHAVTQSCYMLTVAARTMVLV